MFKKLAPRAAALLLGTTPHVLTIADGGRELTTLNVYFDQVAPTAIMSEMTGAWLIRWDKHNRPYPELAIEVPTKENGGVSQDGLTITFHLRKGVRWSDGEPFRASDVLFSKGVVDTIPDDETGGFDQITSLEAPDPYTVVAHLKKPLSTFIEVFFSSCCANPPLLPKHAVAAYSDLRKSPYDALPIGIGPFKYERWDKSRHEVVLVANPLYWRGSPKLEKIVYRIITDRDKLLAELAAHRVDMWFQFGGAFLDRIEALGSVKIMRRPSYAFSHFDFNLTRPALMERSVREALRLALDRRGIIQNVEHGVGVVQDSAIPISAPYFTDLGTTPYDPQRADAILDAGGWARGPDGIRSKNGVRLDITVAIAAGRPDTDKAIAIVQNGWKRIGVNLQVMRYPPAVLFAPASQGGIIFDNTKWDVAYSAFAADPLGDYSSFYACDALPPAGRNAMHWCNESAQRAMDALLNHYQESERSADVKLLMLAFISDVPSIVSAVREDNFAYNPDLKNYDPNAVTLFDNMMDVDI